MQSLAYNLCSSGSWPEALPAPARRGGTAIAAPLVPSQVDETRYLPFLVPFSSFLPFFFIPSSFYASADNRQQRRFLQPPA